MIRPSANCETDWTRSARPDRPSALDPRRNRGQAERARAHPHVRVVGQDGQAPMTPHTPWSCPITLRAFDLLRVGPPGPPRLSLQASVCALAGPAARIGRIPTLDGPASRCTACGFPRSQHHCSYRPALTEPARQAGPVWAALHSLVTFPSWNRLVTSPSWNRLVTSPSWNRLVTSPSWNRLVTF